MAKVTLQILDKHKVALSMAVTSVTSINDKGVFDVLESHSNFISIITNRVVYRTLDGRSGQVSVQDAVMWVRSNSVTIFL